MDSLYASTGSFQLSSTCLMSPTVTWHNECHKILSPVENFVPVGTSSTIVQVVSLVVLPTECIQS